MSEPRPTTGPGGRAPAAGAGGRGPTTGPTGRVAPRDGVDGGDRTARRTPVPAGELSLEDAKLVTLARGARARIGAVEGAAVRDQDGRTYAAASVGLPSLTITALQLAVASAAAAGASTLEAAAVVTEASTLDGAGHAAVRDLSTDAPVHVAAPDGQLLGTVTA